MALAPDGLHRSVRIGREEAIDLMRSRDRLRRRAERRSDAGKREHRPTLVESEPHHLLLLGLGVRLGGASHCPPNFRKLTFTAEARRGETSRLTLGVCPADRTASSNIKEICGPAALTVARRAFATETEKLRVIFRRRVAAHDVVIRVAVCAKKIWLAQKHRQSK